ncbi:hypothetical protein JW711_04310 [Candidatus Woesearchaeota archaeon]|nr:hypothetical protein [Candidatus Woesearchaeota archaeon]
MGWLDDRYCGLNIGKNKEYSLRIKKFLKSRDNPEIIKYLIKREVTELASISNKEIMGFFHAPKINPVPAELERRLGDITQEMDAFLGIRQNSTPAIKQKSNHRQIHVLSLLCLATISSGLFSFSFSNDTTSALPYLTYFNLTISPVIYGLLISDSISAANRADYIPGMIRLPESMSEIEMDCAIFHESAHHAQYDVGFYNDVRCLREGHACGVALNMSRQYALLKDDRRYFVPNVLNSLDHLRASFCWICDDMGIKATTEQLCYPDFSFNWKKRLNNYAIGHTFFAVLQTIKGKSVFADVLRENSVSELETILA